MQSHELVKQVIGPPDVSKNLRARSAMVATILAVGERLATQNLSTFKAVNDGQQILFREASNYARDIKKNVDDGVNILLYGNCGTGKDHICMGLALEAFRVDLSTKFLTGYQLRSAFNEAVTTRQSMSEFVAEFMEPDVLWISDPVETMNAFDATQRALFYAIVDSRYRNKRPIWMTTNCMNFGEASKAIGPAAMDRIRGDALKVYCDWASYRSRQHES